MINDAAVCFIFLLLCGFAKFEGQSIFDGRVGPGRIYFGKKLAMVSIKGVSARKCRFPG